MAPERILCLSPCPDPTHPGLNSLTGALLDLQSLTSVVQEHLVNFGVILAPQFHAVGFTCLAQIDAVKARVTVLLSREVPLKYLHYLFNVYVLCMNICKCMREPMEVRWY